MEEKKSKKEYLKFRTNEYKIRYLKVFAQYNKVVVLTWYKFTKTDKIVKV